MKRFQFLIVAGALTLPALADAFAEPDPLVGSLIIDQLELSKTGNDQAWALDSEISIGRDLNKFILKLEGEKEGADKELEVQALYSKAVAPHWDLQLGVRQDVEPGPERSWGVIGLQGLAPYNVEVDAALFVGESGRTALRLEAEHDILLTQRWILTPELELDLFGKDDLERGIGSGLATAEAGLRLRYEIRREFAPYIGLQWEKSYGETGDLLEAAGQERSDTRWLVGIRAWF